MRIKTLTKADQHHAKAITLAQKENYAAALGEIQHAIAEKPSYAVYQDTLGNILKRLNKLEDAAIAYKKAIKLNPTYAITHNNLGTLFYQQQKFHAAQKSYEKAIVLKPNYTDAINNYRIIGDYYLLHNQFSEAESIFLKLIEYAPDHAELHHRLGIAYFQQKKFDCAKTQFEYVIQKDYQHPEANQYLANTLLELRDHEKAIHYYYRQLEFNAFFETFYNLGVLLMMKDRLKDALIYFEKAIILKPDDAATYLNVGHLYLKQQNKNSAIQAYQKADQLKPSDPEIQYMLAALTQKNTVKQAPKEYVSHLFDQYAAFYDKHLTDALKYDVPQKILRALTLHCPTLLQEKMLSIVDLGCGTGLCGTLFKSFAKSLIGIDLSKNMLSIAEEKYCYDQLIKEDIVIALSKFSNVDLIIAADVLTYLGDLNQLFCNIKKSLHDNGMFIFTVEKTHAADFILQSSMRYAHNKSYLETLIQTHELRLIHSENCVLREQQRRPIEGYLMIGAI